MLANRIYRSMCDCKEVQEMWEPKAGDICVIHTPTRDAKGKLTGKRKSEDFPTDDIHIPVHLQIVLIPSPFKSIYCSGKGYNLDKTNLLFIPHIGDIIKWIKESGEDDNVRLKKLTPKYILRKYMRLVHKKVWKEGKWKRDRT